MFEGSIRSLQVALMAALDQAERLHAEVAKAPLRVQQTVGRQLEEYTIPLLHRLLDREDAAGGVPTLRRTANALEGEADQAGRKVAGEVDIPCLVEQAASAEVKVLTAKDEEEAIEEEQVVLLS